MSSSARYLPRAPRYVFRPGDRSLLRFAGTDKKGSAMGARIRDLSATGIAFVVDSHEAPATGEMLKIEFVLPTGRPRLAWFATVVRVEHKSEWDPDVGNQEFTLVGVRFRKLPPGVAEAIHRNLGKHMNGEDGSAVFDAGPDMSKEKKLAAWYGLALFVSLVLLALPPDYWFAPFRALLP